MQNGPGDPLTLLEGALGRERRWGEWRTEARSSPCWTERRQGPRGDSVDSRGGQRYSGQAGPRASPDMPTHWLCEQGGRCVSSLSSGFSPHTCGLRQNALRCKAAAPRWQSACSHTSLVITAAVKALRSPAGMTLNLSSTSLQPSCLQSHWEPGKTHRSTDALSPSVHT